MTGGRGERKRYELLCDVSGNAMQPTRVMTSDASTTVGRAAGATQVRRGGRSAPRHGCQPSGIKLLLILAVVAVVLFTGCGQFRDPVAYCRKGVKEIRSANNGTNAALIVCNEGRVYER